MRSGPKSTLVFHLPNAKLWHPDHPYLYDLDVRIVEVDEVVDQVKSYFAMRKFGKTKDEKGLWRFTLNNKPIFQYGPLDQGYFPDGLYTPPSEEAMLFDID